jgi:hypothetical protein
MTSQAHPSLAASVAGVVKDHMGKWFRVLADRIDVNETRAAERIKALESRIAELEGGGHLNLADAHKGVWSAEETYARGELVTDHGSCWLALAATHARPGSNGDWKLIVKRGADAR